MKYGAWELWLFETTAKTARAIFHYYCPSFGALGQSRSLIWIVVGY
jgi:hypothetical protein